jgi:hypothetical protein
VFQGNLLLTGLVFELGHQFSLLIEEIHQTHCTVSVEISSSNRLLFELRKEGPKCPMP